MDSSIAKFLRPILNNSQKNLLIHNEESRKSDSESVVEETPMLSHPQPRKPPSPLLDPSFKEEDYEKASFVSPDRIRETFSGADLQKSAGSISNESSESASRSATSPPVASVSHSVGSIEPIVELPVSPKKRGTIFMRASKKFKRI